jgi:hypothetical protein
VLLDLRESKALVVQQDRRVHLDTLAQQVQQGMLVVMDLLERLDIAESMVPPDLQGCVE